MFGRSKVQPNGLVLCFRADGAYWADLVHLLAYPVGISYIWPFRYSSDLIEKSLRDELDRKDRRSKLVGSRLLICTRFQKDPAKELIIPMRRATLVEVDVSATFYSFTFRLGGSFAFHDQKALRPCAIETTQDVGHLAFRENVQPPLRDIDDAESLAMAWKEFAQLINDENKIPIEDNARRSLFFHIAAPSDGGTAASVGKLKAPAHAAQTYGYKLKQGRRYLINFAHYVPALESHNTTIREISVAPKTAGQDIEINAATQTLIGNYGLNPILLAAVEPSSIWRKFEIAPVERTLTSQTGNHVTNAHMFPIPFAVTWSIWVAFRRTFVPNLLLFLALFVVGAASLIEKNLEKLVNRSLKWEDIWSNWPLIVIVMIGSLLASFVIPVFLHGKSK